MAIVTPVRSIAGVKLRSTAGVLSEFINYMVLHGSGDAIIRRRDFSGGFRGQVVLPLAEAGSDPPLPGLINAATAGVSQHANGDLLIITRTDALSKVERYSGFTNTLLASMYTEPIAITGGNFNSGISYDGTDDPTWGTRTTWYKTSGYFTSTIVTSHTGFHLIEGDCTGGPGYYFRGGSAKNITTHVQTDPDDIQRIRVWQGQWTTTVLDTLKVWEGIGLLPGGGEASRLDGESESQALVGFSGPFGAFLNPPGGLTQYRMVDDDVKSTIIGTLFGVGTRAVEALPESRWAGV